MIEKYLDEIKNVVKEKSISLNYKGYYIVKISNTFYEFELTDYNYSCVYKNYLQPKELYEIYTNSNFSLHIQYNVIYSEEYVKFGSGFLEYFKTLRMKPGFKFCISSNDTKLESFLKTHFSKYSNFDGNQYYEKHISCYVSVLCFGNIEFFINYFELPNKNTNKVRITLTSDGGFYISKYSDKLKNLSVDKHYFEIHYGQQFFKELKKFNINISQAVNKNNKRFYERFEKYLT